ncbi:MAG: endonuclease III [archaeon GW2011_AR5]|nr:MAG: endonuclease III [archaeon GW2011_AR5]
MQPQDALKFLKKEYPKTKYYLNFSNPLELLVAAIMSAQARDAVVNATTPNLFKKYRTAKDYANADFSELSNDINAVNFPVPKAKNIIAACKILVEKHGGKVPASMEELIELPGVGRKTANAIMQNAFGRTEGVVVDTHVIRVSYRLGWTKQTNPEKIERELMQLFPKKEWKKLPHLLKDHGRAVCRAPMPVCSRCTLGKICPRQGVTKSL